MVLSYISFFTFSVFILLGAKELIFEPKTKLNIAFFFIAITASFWAFTYIFIFTETNKQSIWFWYRLSSFGWLCCNYAVFNYLYVFSNLKNKLIIFIIRILLFIVMIYLIYIQLTKTLFVVDFLKTPFGNAEIIDVSLPGYWFFSFYSLFCVLIGFVLILIGIKYNNLKRYKIQVKGLIVSISTSFIFIFLFNVYLPLSMCHFPSIGAIATCIFVAGVFILIQRYKLMRLDYGFLKEEVIDTISDILVIVSSEGNIIKSNQTFRYNFHIEDGVSVDDFIRNRKYLISSLKDMNDLKVKKKLKYLMIKNDENKELIANVTLFPVYDEFKDYIGTIIHAKILNEYEHIMNFYKIAPQEKKVILLAMEGFLNKEIAAEMLISENTVKNYIYNIYKKTGVVNKVELLQMFFPKEI